MAPRRSIPYLAFETLEQIRVQNGLPLKAYEVQKNYLKAVGKGMLKVMSKMGISTYQSYCGAQIFDAVGLSSAFVETCFTGTATHDRGRRLHRDRRGSGGRAIAMPMTANPIYRDMLDVGGDYAFRLRGEAHAWTPESVASLQHAARGNSPDDYAAFARDINDQNERLLTIRGLMELRCAERPVPLERGRAGGRDRQAFRHRRDELRLDLA